MGSAPRISIVGAGSAVFSMRILSDICKVPELRRSNVVLMDVDKVRLENVHTIGLAFSKYFDAQLEISTTTDLAKALDGSDFVINTALAGGHFYLEKVRLIGEKYGYYRGIDAQNFNFVSDYYNLTNWNQFALFLKIARLLEKFAPNAWYLQAANPVLEGITLVSNETSVKAIGFCHGHHGVRLLADALGVKSYVWQVAGVNHGIWLTKFETTDGRDLYPQLETLRGRYVHNPRDPFDDQLAPVAWEMYDLYGLFPVGDTVRNSTWKFHRNLEVKKRWYGAPWGGADSELGWKWYESQLRKAVDGADSLAKALRSGQTLEGIRRMLRWVPFVDDESKQAFLNFLDPERFSGEQHVPFIRSVVTGQAERFVLNVLNKGKIPQLDDDVAVELPATVQGERISFETVSLPRGVVDWYLKPRIILAKQALLAFKERNVGLVAELLERDWRTVSSTQVSALVDELYPVVLEELARVESA